MNQTNWRALQASGAFRDKQKRANLRPGSIKPRYMAMGSWHANLTKEGKRG